MDNKQAVVQLDNIRLETERRRDHVDAEPWTPEEKTRAKEHFGKRLQAIDMAINALQPEGRKPMSEFFAEREEKGHE